MTTQPTNTLYRPSLWTRITKTISALWQSLKCALIGSLATLFAIALIWCIQNRAALGVVISHPDVVAGLKIESSTEIKK